VLVGKEHRVLYAKTVGFGVEGLEDLVLILSHELIIKLELDDLLVFCI